MKYKVHETMNSFTVLNKAILFLLSDDIDNVEVCTGLSSQNSQKNNAEGVVVDCVQRLL